MQRRGGKRIRQTIYITEDTRKMLDEFSKVHGINLSQSAESLMLVGLQDTKSIGQAELMAATVRREMVRQYNRFAKLSAVAAIEAGAAKEMVKSVYWYLLLAEYGNYEDSLEDGERPSFDEFAAMFRVPTDSATWKIVGGMLKQRTQGARFNSVKSLRSGFEFIHDLMQEMDDWEAEFEADETEDE